MYSSHRNEMEEVAIFKRLALVLRGWDKIMKWDLSFPILIIGFLSHLKYLNIFRGEIVFNMSTPQPQLANYFPLHHQTMWFGRLMTKFDY